MSLKSWEKEFYPVTAEECAKGGGAVACLEHSIRKWTGLLPKNLAKHRMRTMRYRPGITDGHRRIGIDSYTCALCQWAENCRGCPIRKDGGCGGSALEAWYDKGNPRPMLRVMREALRAQKAGGKP